jgi:hypothetical protein
LPGSQILLAHKATKRKGRLLTVGVVFVTMAALA